MVKPCDELWHVFASAILPSSHLPPFPHHLGIVFALLLCQEHWKLAMRDLTTNESINWEKYEYLWRTLPSGDIGAIGVEQGASSTVGVPQRAISLSGHHACAESPPPNPSVPQSL